ncbi:MAG: class I SAM-dependent methyltransferase [Clostridia bacterium]|nr:class I SAM-dependent methyltransferase [Clostridia bacterium]
MDKSNTSDNPYIYFYGEHNVSPVRQDISDITQHYMRREGLYRSLGIPPFVFNGKRMLEVGPGGGYNSLYFLKMGARLDLVEPNPKGQEEIMHLFHQRNIEKARWKLHNTVIEDYCPEQKYDIVIAEGFISGLLHRNKVIERLSDVVSNGGVLVVTCADEISLFFEYLKRLVAWKLIKKVNEFEDKIRILSNAFLTHLSSLSYATRPIDDWVIDTLINPAICFNSFSIADCINEFGDNFKFLGSSPDMFTNYSWYKDTDYNTNENVLKQFYSKRHLLFITGIKESERAKESNEKLLTMASDFRQIVLKIETEGCPKGHWDIAVQLLKHLQAITGDIDIRIPQIIEEALLLLNDGELNSEKVSKSKKLVEAFGRGQQYVSMVKNVFS